MTNNQTFSNRPINTTKTINDADLADHRTSKELIVNTDNDAYFFRSLEKQTIYLNEAQIEAARHIDGPCLVLAGAGSGKTRVLTSRTGYLISVQNINPKQIMLVTFTKKAADEMRERLHSSAGLTPQVIRSITIGTFHSIFLRLLRSRGYQQQVLSNEKRKQVAIKIILKQKDLQDAYEPESLLAILSDYKTRLIQLNELPEKSKVEKEIKDILLTFEKWKKDNQLIDFDDMLVETYHLLTSDSKLLQMMQKRFSYILCDEWQDTNPVQFELIKLISKPNNNLFVVGDDDQTIYSFNGADSSIILNFEKLYPNAKVVTLDINYRSTNSIIGLANEVIAYNQERKTKTLKVANKGNCLPMYANPKTTDEEADIIIKKIVADIDSGKRQYQDFAILHRTNSSSRAIFDQLVLKGIPFITYTKEETFYQQPLVKPVVDYLRLVITPANTSAIPSILPTLYINREKAMYHIEANQLISPKQKPLEQLLSFPGLKPFQTKQLKERLALLNSLKNEKPIQAIKKIRLFYDTYLETNERQQLTMHKEMILETLAELEASAKKFSTIDAFLTFINEVIEKNKEMETIRRTPNANAVSLMTIHRSKGLEFPVIFLTGASEKILPHSSAIEASDRKDLVTSEKGNKKVQSAIEEERRLTYVAITRAKQELYITSPMHYRGEQLDISRFILDPFLTKSEQTERQLPNGSTSILVWNCSNENCICWMRITTQEETMTDSRECPMCKGTMRQEVKKIDIKN